MRESAARPERKQIQDWVYRHPHFPQLVDHYNDLFDLGAIGADLGYPLFLKPYDGGAWVGVSRLTDGATLNQAYDASGQRVMHLQKAVEPYKLFIQSI